MGGDSRKRRLSEGALHNCKNLRRIISGTDNSLGKKGWPKTSLKKRGQWFGRGGKSLMRRRKVQACS